MNKKFLLRFFVVIAIILAFGFSKAPDKAEAYYGMLGGMYGMYGLGMLGGMYGMYGLGMMGGMYGMYGMYGMGSPFSIYNMYYPVDTGNGLTYQLPFMMALPYLGMSGLYKQLFPNLFSPSTTSLTPSTTSVL